MDETNMNNVTVPDGKDEAVDVDLARPGSRIAAYLLNILFTVIAYIPLLAGLVLPSLDYLRRAGGLENPEVLAQTDWGGPWALVGVLVLLVYGVAQLWMMSRSGQSFGKKIMKIRVLKTDGRNPGFLGTVIVRELVFNIIVTLASWIVTFLVALALGFGGEEVELLGNLLSLLPWLVCLAMLFNVSKDRRTLQDLLANTVVVRLPEK